VDEDLADVLGGLEPHVLPALAPVLALVDAVAVADAALRVVLAGAHPHHVRVVRVDRHAADRVGALAVEDGRPGGAGVLRLPHAAGGGRQEPPPVVRGVDGDVDDPAGRHGGADAAQLEAAPGVGRPAALRLLLLALLLLLPGGRALLRGLCLLRRLRLRLGRLLAGLVLVPGRGLLRRLGLRLLGGSSQREERGQRQGGHHSSQLVHVQLQWNAPRSRRRPFSVLRPGAANHARNPAVPTEARRCCGQGTAGGRAFAQRLSR
jgi:hypothetical protein